MPVADGQLGGDDRGAEAVAFFDGLEKVLLFAILEAGEAEIVNDQNGELGESFEQPIVDALSARLDEVRQERRQAQILNAA